MRSLAQQADIGTHDENDKIFIEWETAKDS